MRPRTRVPCPCGAARARAAGLKLHQFAFVLETGDPIRRVVRPDAGPAHQVGRGKTGEAGEPGRRQARSRASPVQSRSMRSSISRCRRRTLRAAGCNTWPPPSVCSADEFAHHERLAPRCRRPLVEEQLRQAPLAGRDRVTVQQRDHAHDLRRSDVEAHRQAVLDRPLHVAQAVQPHRQHARRREVAGRGDFLPADHLLMADAGEVDGRALAAMHLLDGRVVVL